MSFIKIYSKPNCPLCNEVIEQLDLTNIDYREIDILQNEDLYQKYRYEIPVLEAPWGIWRYAEKTAIPLLTWLEKGAE